MRTDFFISFAYETMYRFTKPIRLKVEQLVLSAEISLIISICIELKIHLQVNKIYD